MDPFAPKRSRVTHEDAEKLAIDALSFLAGEPGLLAQFAAVTGHTPATIRAEIASPEFLVGILDFLMDDESLLLVFASHQGITPPDIIAARQMLAPDRGVGLTARRPLLRATPRCDCPVPKTRRCLRDRG